jgi:gamma-glutamyltranspeptidase / glutathione hydrolase
VRNSTLHRRDFLKWAGAGLAGSRSVWAQEPRATTPRGLVAGQAEAVRAGQDILDAGGNAVDAAVAAALVAGVVAISDCGPGGYGGHLMIATGNGQRVTAIDFNTAAPRAARPDMFPLGPDGQVQGRRNAVGWLAAGVPGTLAGLQLALDRHGSLPLGRVLQPAIRYARDGFTVNTGLATVIRNSRAALERDPASARLLLPGGKPPAVGARFRNPELADVLETLARRNSVESFYRGDIARRIADAFARNGGLVTAEDLASYRAREVEPLELSWRGYSIRTAPLTAGGLTVLEALSVLRALDWPQRDPSDPRTTHLRVEVLRAVWDDRLRLLGDRPDVPTRRLLSEEYGRQIAARVETAVREGRRLPATTDGRSAGGTIHLSAVDAAGTMVALTLTHGESFGAKVTVDGLGLILGHGMVRFDPHPDHPNAPGPGKRPLHNMCPTIVLKDGRPILAVGGRGGRRIPSALFDVLSAFVGRGASLADAIAAPRLHSEGGTRMVLERTWPETHVNYLRRIGYETATGASAMVFGVALDPRSGERQSAGR